MAGGLPGTEAQDPEVFTCAIAFGATAEDGLEELENVGGGLDADFLVGTETDGHEVEVLKGEEIGDLIYE